jgi:hypothetical protein
MTIFKNNNNNKIKNKKKIKKKKKKKKKKKPRNGSNRAFCIRQSNSQKMSRI